MSLRRKREVNKKRFKNILRWQIVICGLFILIFMLYGLYSYTIYRISNKSAEVVVGRYESIGDELTAEAIVLNEETTFYAPNEGYFENTVKENDKIRKNDLAGYFVPASRDKQPVLAITPGIFSLQTDGLEKMFQSIDFETVTHEVFNYKPNIGPQKYFYTGDPVYKIINNLNATKLLIHFSKKELITKVKPGQYLDIIYNKGKYSKSKIINVKMTANEVILLVEMADFCPDMLGRRYIKSKCIINLHNGYLLPQKAIVTKGSTKGIYCIKRHDIYFKTVKIVKKQKEMVLVKGIDGTDMVIAHPGFFLKYMK